MTQMPAKDKTEHWKVEPDEHDYPAAVSYLSLIVQPDAAQEVVARMRTAELQHFKAKDLLRASRLTLLPAENFHVAADLRQGQAWPATLTCPACPRQTGTGCRTDGRRRLPPHLRELRAE